MSAKELQGSVDPKSLKENEYVGLDGVDYHDPHEMPCPYCKPRGSTIGTMDMNEIIETLASVLGRRAIPELHRDPSRRAIFPAEEESPTPAPPAPLAAKGDETITEAILCLRNSEEYTLKERMQLASALESWAREQAADFVKLEDRIVQLATELEQQPAPVEAVAQGAKVWMDWRKSFPGLLTTLLRASGAGIPTGRAFDELNSAQAAAAGPRELMTREWKEASIALRSLCAKALDTLNRYLPPDGISAQDALNELLGTFDGPDQRAAFSLHDALVFLEKEKK